MTRGFFAGLRPMAGAVRALLEMEAEGIHVRLVTDPVLASRFCLQEKVEWIRRYLGERWVSRLVVSSDKTMVKGDMLIDDMPFELYAPEEGGKHTLATWKRVLFDQPYNHRSTHENRLTDWARWREVVMATLGKPDEGLVHAKDAGTGVTTKDVGVSVSGRQGRQRRSDSHARLVDTLLDANAPVVSSEGGRELLKSSLSSEVAAYQGNYLPLLSSTLSNNDNNYSSSTVFQPKMPSRRRG
jgi:5'(3')-deoxyribonucleotidase